MNPLELYAAAKRRDANTLKRRKAIGAALIIILLLAGMAITGRQDFCVKYPKAETCHIYAQK